MATVQAPGNEIVNPAVIKYGITGNQQEQISAAETDFTNAQNLKVSSSESYVNAADFLSDIKRKIKSLNADRIKITSPMDTAKKEIMALFNKPINRLELAQRTIEESMINYTYKVQRKKKEEDAQREELARREREKLQKRADQAMAKGKTEKAEILQEQAESVPVVPSQIALPTAQGTSTRKTWYAEVVNLDLFLQAVVEGKIPKIAININMPFLNKQAVSLKGEFNYPGAIAKTKQNITSRL